MGHLIPAGTGLHKYNKIKIMEEVSEEELLNKEFTEEELAEMLSEVKGGAG